MDTTTKKSAYIRARVRPQTKKGAESILSRLGMSTSDAIGVFLSQVSLQGGLPFEVKVPNAQTRTAFREDTATMKSYTNAGEMFDDILGKDWKKKR